jgi:hypothetical protein
MKVSSIDFSANDTSTPIDFFFVFISSCGVFAMRAAQPIALFPLL